MEIKKVTVINNLDKVKLSKIYSAHDFDLGYNLKLLQQIGKLEKVTIFGVPAEIKKQTALKQLVELIEGKYN